MNIGFDAKRAAQNRTGLGNYSRFVIRILSEKFAGNQYHLYTPKPHRMPYFQEIPTIKHLFLHFPPQGIWSRLRSLWRVWGISKDIQKDGIQIFHGLSNELPLNIGTPEQRKMKAGGKGCKYIVTVHDLIFIHTPQYYHWIDRQIYNFKFRRACRCADRVIAVSEYTKQEIMHYYHTPESKIDVVYQGCDPVFSQEIEAGKLQEVKARYQLPDKFVLYVGSIEERKNLLLAVEAVARLAARGERVHLVAVGRRTSYLDKIERRVAEEGIEDLFHVYHGVGYTDLPSFYRLASAFVYPSRVEGFGIPLLEAITAGVPAIGCTGSCLEEAGGPSSLYVSPDDVEAMSAAISRIMSDDALRCAMISEGLSYSRRFAAPTLAQDLMAVYQKVMNQS